MATLVYVLHWLFFISAIAFSWKRSRAVLHPHFIFTSIICIQLVDFLVRGYDDGNLRYIPDGNVYDFQIIILTIFAITIILTSMLRSPRLEMWSRNAGRHLHVGPKVRIVILLLVVGLVLADAYKRFSTVDWSMSEVVRQSLMPRGQRDWDQLQYAGNFLFAITTILLPLAGIAAGYLTAAGSILLRLIAFLSITFILLVLVTNGSRTPVVVVLASTCLFWYLKQRTTVMRVMAIVVAAGAIAISTSLMFLYRSYGFISDRVQVNQEFNLIYHMDDSYYRAILAYDYADSGAAQWDPLFFFYTIIVNPIPRAIWPSKPLLTSDFYGGYKLDYVTNLFLGEMVAMTGVYGTIIFSPIVGLLLYFILFRAQKLIRMPMGLAAYLLFALYVYMCTRSLLNLTHFLYLPAFTAVAVMLLRRIERQPAHRHARPRWRRYR